MKALKMPVTAKQAEAAAAKLREQLATLNKLTGKPDASARMRESRAIARDLTMPEQPADAERRRSAEADDCKWLRTYCSDVFYNPFTPHQVRIVEDCAESLKYGTLKCKAAPRGDGKTSIVKYLALKYALTRKIKFVLIVAATAAKSNKVLNSLKRRLASGASLNTRTMAFSLNNAMGEDYPVECCTASYVDPWPSRARNVTANGRKSIHVEWGGDMLIVPTWEQNEPLGPIIVSHGITSDELQGCNIYDLRPDFVMLDDLDSRDSLASQDGLIASKIMETVDKTVAGLGGQSRRLGQFMLCTITSPESAAFQYSSPSIKPAWSGERIPAIVSWPSRADLWQQYVELRQWGQSTIGEGNKPVDVFGRKAHQFLLDNFDVMHEGAVLSNPANYERDVLPDGTPTHVSALQRCYDWIADKGMRSFQTEHQNDPPEEESASESGINVRLVQSQVSGLERGVVPEGCTQLTQGIDCGKFWFHWVVRAWRPDGSGFTIDYGRHSVYGTKSGSDEGVDRAVRGELVRRMNEFREMDYAKQFRDSVTLIDSGYRSEAVYQACIELGQGVFPIKGIGTSAGVSERGRFHDVMKRTRDKQPVCDGVFTSRQAYPGLPAFKLVCASADQWKCWEHDRWMTATDKPGVMKLFGLASEHQGLLSPDQRDHGHYAHHICAEVEVEDIVKGGIVRRWRSHSKENHWLDASYYADVGAAMKGIRILGTIPVAKPASERPTAAQLASRLRRA